MEMPKLKRWAFACPIPRAITAATMINDFFICSFFWYCYCNSNDTDVVLLLLFNKNGVINPNMILLP